MNEKTYKVKRIENGTAIDHITPGKAMRCLRLLDPNTDNVILMGMNVDSKKMGEKDFIKIEDYYPTKKEVNKVSMIAPEATINKIKNKKVVEKEKVTVPDKIKGNIECKNPKCATNHEPHLTPEYKTENVDPIELRCSYCDSVLKEEDITKQRFSPD